MNRQEEVIFRMRKRYMDLGVVGADAKIGVRSFVSDPSQLQPRDVGGQRLIRVRATTGDIDVAGEVVDPDGADMTYIHANRQIFSDHRYDTEFAVGSLRYTTREGNGYAQLINLRRGMSRSLADDIWIIANDIGIGASIGFDAQEVSAPTKKDAADWQGASAVIRSWRWLETSLTCFPCNPSCQMLGAYSDDQKAAKLDEMVTKGAIRRESAFALGYQPAKPRLVIRLG